MLLRGGMGVMGSMGGMGDMRGMVIELRALKRVG